MDHGKRQQSPWALPVAHRKWKRLGLPGLTSQAAPKATGGNDYHALARALKDHAGNPPVALGGAEVMTADTIAEVLGYLWTQYTTDLQPRSLDILEQQRSSLLGAGDYRTWKGLFADAYPVAPRRITDGDDLLVEVLGENPAMSPLCIVMEDRAVTRDPRHRNALLAAEKTFASLPPHPGTGMTLLESLREPARRFPSSLSKQLAFIREHWGEFLPDELTRRLALTQDILAEETAQRGPLGPPELKVMEFSLDHVDPEIAAFSADADWMSNVVLMAKSTYVWLHQLSRWHHRPIERLDQIPDEELDRLARWGVSGLWLIGLWRRSAASRQIKNIMGNPDAVASAYSLDEYAIAEDLGGEEAFQNLKGRAASRGIRLAGDMVPNHMGLDSRWVIERPHLFLQAPTPPYPGYSFSGADLSPDSSVSIHIEDGYWSHQDAAVVFRRRDNNTGEERFVYHGNDGTSMPWNDTAQLDYLRQETREAVIQTILDVARRFPIIRFDAAMTLAKKHFQRLWYPKAGDAGAIPSRAVHGMTKPEFDNYFPVEFWREVVDRVASEVPDTLLLAEAFWLMEGYFVRTLGMHRVYNSAFMNMLKMEENGKYRETIKNVLEFSPEILKRFVNFMNNPDERTAVEQFGTGDKYFGVATLLVTMPGLPMVGHGQVEGFTEKYGMEYKRAYYDEDPDTALVDRHMREIFPLMRRRYLFSQVDHFALYDCVDAGGHVNENVLAYSNRSGDQRTVVLVNNAYEGARGTIRDSVPFNQNRTGEAADLRRIHVFNALALPPGHIVRLKEHPSGLERLLHTNAILNDGLQVDLGGYQVKVFLDIQVLDDPNGDWERLHHRLNGGSVTSLDTELRLMRLEPLHEVVRDFIVDVSTALAETPGVAMDDFQRKLLRLATALEQQGLAIPPKLVARSIEEGLKELATVVAAASLTATEESPEANPRFLALPVWSVFLASLNKAGPEDRFEGDPLELKHAAALAFQRLWDGWEEAVTDAFLGEALSHVLFADAANTSLPDSLSLRRWLQVHEHKGDEYLLAEPWQRLGFWMTWMAPILSYSPLEELAQSRQLWDDWARECGYQWVKIRALPTTPPEPTPEDSP